MKSMPGRITIARASYMEREPFLNGTTATIDFINRKISLTNKSKREHDARVRIIDIQPESFEELLTIGMFDDYEKYTLMEERDRHMIYGPLNMATAENDGYTTVEISDACLMNTIRQDSPEAYVNSPYNQMLNWLYRQKQ